MMPFWMGHFLVQVLLALLSDHKTDVFFFFFFGGGGGFILESAHLSIYLYVYKILQFFL